jgi:hypothetical protein
MTSASFPIPTRRSSLLLPIVAGGATAGTLDLIAAFFTYGREVPKVIAEGLIGRQALQGGATTWVLGVVLHFFIAFASATIYCLASRKLEFLRDHFLVCGLFYGIAVFLVMKLVVLPLSALHFTGPYRLHGLLQGLGIHVFLVGLPISLSLRLLSA